MCGIAVIVDPSRDGSARDVIAAMNGAAAHRGPDSSGALEIGNVVLGHTRLAIIDLSSGGRQPFSQGRHHLTFNGEIYNYRELRDELRSAGRCFVTQSDTEVLLTALVHWGVEALHRLQGMFAFAYLDERNDTLLLVRDRFGEKPLVFTEDGSRLLAASEAKQIVAVLGGSPRVDIDAALTFLARGSANTRAQTFFQDVREVPAGHYLSVDVRSGAQRLVRWYDLPARVRPQSEPYEIARERVRTLLLASVRQRHVADVPIGLCLSGGVDSSVIAGLTATLFGGRRFRAITSYSLVPGYDERLYSRAVTDRFELDPIEIRPNTRRIWNPDDLADLCRVQDQPLASGSQYNEFCVFEAARDAGLPVMLDGQGADEYFGGYGEFWFSAQCEALRGGDLRAFMEGVRARADGQNVSKSIVLERFARSLATVLRRTVPKGDAEHLAWAKHVAPEPLRKTRGAMSFADLSLEQMQCTSLPFQVHSEDRNAMHWSIEARLPFLDHALVEYVLSLPTAFKCRRGTQKAILRDAVCELPDAVARRLDKIGFASPDAAAFFEIASEVRMALRDTLGRLTPLLKADVLLARFDRSVSERAYDPLVFRLLSFDAWMRAFRCAL